jgi:hypothetical protein
VTRHAARRLMSLCIISAGAAPPQLIEQVFLSCGPYLKIGLFRLVYFYFLG